MVNKKSLPKGSLSRFPVLGRELKQVLHKSEVSFSTSYYLNQLPKIPKPSIQLQKALQQFGAPLHSQDTNSCYLGKDKIRRPTKKTTKVNAFLAYRAFYCRFIPKVETQRKLSIVLGKVWVDEKNKSCWERYAAEYNSASTNLQFPEWLETKLGNKMYVKLNQMWGYKESIVEDVYYTT